jgi:hypothetical protein
MAVDPLNSFARAQRAFEHLNLYRIAHGDEGMNRWLAISLKDGTCDQHPYATKAEAVRFQPRERECAYFFFNGMPTLGELRLYLDTNEELYDNGYSLSDPADYVNPEFLL